MMRRMAGRELRLALLNQLLMLRGGWTTNCVGGASMRVEGRPCCPRARVCEGVYSLDAVPIFDIKHCRQVESLALEPIWVD